MFQNNGHAVGQKSTDLNYNTINPSGFQPEQFWKSETSKNIVFKMEDKHYD